MILNSTCYFVRNFLKRRLDLLYFSFKIYFYEELSELSSEELLCMQLSSLNSERVSDESVSLSYEESETDSDTLLGGSDSSESLSGSGGSFERSQYFG